MPRIYVACLASYNNGVLHGEWIDLDGQDTDDVQAEIAKMLRASKFPNVEVECPTCEGEGQVIEPDGYGGTRHVQCSSCSGKGQVPSAEEWAVHDYDDLPGTWGEYPDLKDLIEFATLYEEHGEAFAAFVADCDGEVDEEAFREKYQGTHDTEAAWAEDFMDSTGGLEAIPEHLRYYFDFESYARDCRLGGDVTFVRGSSGLHVFWNH